jgi:hypothetical protein
LETKGLMMGGFLDGFDGADCKKIVDGNCRFSLFCLSVSQKKRSLRVYYRERENFVDLGRS